MNNIKVDDIGENVIRCQVSTVASSMVSNITGFAKAHMESLFPKDYFKNIFLTTSLTSSAFSKNADDEDVTLNKTPQMSMTPSIALGFNDTSFGIIPKWRRGIIRYINRPRAYREVFYNDYDRIAIWTVPSRFKTMINYKIMVDTYMEKIDTVQFLRSKFESGEKFFINGQLLEAEVPQSLIKAIANIKEFDLEDNDDVLKLIEYLNLYSSGYLTRKRNLSTGNEMFSFMYAANILVTVEDPPSTDTAGSEKISMVDGKNIIEFTLSYEVWSPTHYIFQSYELPRDDYMIYNNENVTIDYTVRARPNRIRDDKVMIAWSKFVTNANESVDEIVLDDLLDRKTLKVIKQLKKEHLYEYLDTMYDIVCYRDNYEMERNVDYSYSWRDNKIVLKLHDVLLNYVYSVGIFVNQKLFQEELIKFTKK